MANETDSVFAADQQNGKGELYRLMMSILKEGETDNQETAQQQPTSEVEKANDDTATQQPAAEPQNVQQPTVQPQEQPKQQAEQPKGEVEQPAQTVQPVQDVQADELDDDTSDLLAIKNHNIDDARKYVEQLGKDTQEIMASGMSEGAKRKAQQRYESAAKALNERIETHNAEQKAENERLRADAERKQAQAKKEHDEKYADINYVSDWMDGHKVSEANNTMLASEGFKEGAAAASGKDIFGIAKAAKEYISENTGKLSTAAINDYVNGMLAANRLKEKYGDKFSYNIEPIDSLVLENKDIPDSVKKEFVKVRTPKEFGDNNYQSILGNAVDDFVRLFEKEYRREQGKVGKKAMEDYDNIAKNPFADVSDKDAARMVFASKVLTGVDLKPMIDRAFNSIPKDRLAALTLALSKDFGYDENKSAEYIANEFQRVCLARTGAKVNSDTEAVIIGGLMNTLVGSFAQASMRSTGGGNGLTLLDAYNASIDERAKEWAKQGMAGYGKIALRSATTMAGDSPLLGGIGKLVGSGTKWSLVRLLPRFSKGVTPKAGEAAFKLLSMTNSGRVVIGVANGAGLGAIYSPAAYGLGSLARGVTPELGEALKSSASGAVDFSMMGFTPSIMNYGADKVLKLFNGTGKAATAIRVATNIAFKDIFGPGANAALVTAKDVLLSNEKISEDLKSYYFEKFGEFLGMHVPGKLSNIRHIADEYKVRTQLNESVFTKEELRSLGYKSVKQMFDDIYAPNGKNSPGYFMKDGKAIASKLYGITVNPKVLESAKMKLLTAIGGGAIATPTITRSEIVSEYGEKGKEVYTVRTYTADGKAFSERDFGSLKDAKLEETRLGTVIKRNNVAIAEGARDAQWMDTCSERATRTVLSELNGTATEKELTDMIQTAFEKDRNVEQLTDGEKRMLKRFDEVYLQNLRSENADNSSSVRSDFNKSRGVDIDKILAKDYYKWSESEREAVDEYIKALNGENTAKDMPSEQTEPTAPSEPPANESPVVEAEKGAQQEVIAPEKEAEKPSEETPSKESVGIEDYIKINKADDETANDIREDAENYTDEVNALRAESEQAVRYSNGESSEKPEHWDYWKEKFGLEEPKAKTGEEVQPVEEPKADSEPIEPADEKPTEQPKEPKAEEKPVEAETPKEEAKADTKTEVEQAAETKPVEEAKQEQPTVDQLNQYFSHVHLGHELTEKDLGDKARMEMFTKQFLSDKEQAIKYSNGELSEKPEGYAYMKQMFGLKDPVKQPTTNNGKAEKDANKTAQLDVVNKSNPMRDEQHTGIRSVDDIKTFEEAVSDSDAPFTPDYTKEDAESALKAGEITVYSSKPIEDGVFVTPSKMEAKNYAGNGKVFSKRVSIKDVAWIDAIEGQYARLRASDIETGAKESVEREGVAYKKGEELVVEHDGTPVTIVVDAVGKDGNVTKSHVKSSGEPYHSNGKVVFTPKEKPQEQAVKDWVDDTASEARKRGYRIVNGERGADGKGGVDSTAEEGSNHVTGTAAKAADKDSYDVTEDTAKYRIREDAPPTKTGIGYKVFVLKDGKLYSPMVANPNGEATPVGVWLDADAAPVTGVTKTGRQQVKAGGKGTQGGSGKLAYHPGWHLGEIPYALQFNRMNTETGQRELFPANFVWAEVEYANDVDYQEEAMSYGMKASGKFQHSLAGLPRLPKNGSYRYRTNPDPNTDPWVITGAMKVNRILKPSEVDAMIEAAGREPQQRQAGSITDKQVEALNAKVERTMQEDRDMMRSVVQQMGEKLHTDINIIEDVNEITHSNAAVQERRRKSKGWYDTKTGQVNIVLANNRDVDDVKASVGHEVIAHKGLRELFGEENYDQFLDETYQHLRDDLKKGVDAASGRSFVDDATKNGNRAKSYEQHRRTAVDELFGRMAEKPFEEFSEGERTLWQKTKATVRRLLDKFLGSLKLPKWFELSDNELRYILWRSKERLERGKEHPIDLARDIVKREELGLTDEALYNMGDNPETFAERQRRAVEKKGVVMSGLNSAEVTAVKVPKHPYTGNIAHATEQAKAAAIEKYTEIIKDERGKEKRVAKPQTYDNYGVTFQYGISADAIDEYLNPRQQAKSVNKGVHLALAEHIHEVIGASIEVEEHPDRMKVEGERSNNQFNPNSLMHRFYGVVLVDGHPYRVMTLMREEKNPAVGNGMHAYEVQKIEVLDEETPNTPNGTDSQNHNGLSYPVAKVIEKVEKTMESGKNLLEESKIADEDTAMYRDPGETEDIRFRKVEGYDSKHAEIERAVNKKLKRGSTSDDIKAEIDSVKKLRAEATKEYLSGKPHSEVAKGDAAALRERLNELNAKKTIAVENERSAKLTEKLADLNSKLIEATEGGDTEKAKSLTTEIKRLKTDIGNTGIRSRYKAKISEIKSKSENVSDLAKSLVKYISGELSPILAKEMGKAEFNALVRSVRDIAKQWNAKDGTEQDRNNLATKLDDTIRKVDDVIVGIETRKLIRDLADMLSVKTTKKDSSGKKVGVKVSNTVRIVIETLKGMFSGFNGEFGNGLKSLVKSLDGMLAKKKSLQGRLKELELSETSANERLNSGAITKDEYDAEIEAINRERDDVKSEMANFDTVFSDALSETNDAIDTAVPRTTMEYDMLWNDLMAKQQDEQDGVAQMSAHDKEMLKIMPFVRSLVDVRELFAEADKSQSRLKALEEQWKSDAPTPTDTEMEAANRRDRRLQTALKIREERARLFAAKDAARKALRDLNNDVRSLLKIGKTQYMAQQQERLEHRSEVAHIGIAAVDTGKERPAGVKGQQEAKESEEKSVGVLRRLWNWVFLAPTESAESMLSRVDVNHFSGEGELYHLIMESERGYSRSEDRRIESVDGLRSEIQSKCKELFGSKKSKDGNKKIKFTQTLSGEPVPAEVTKGEALSLYLWSLSEEGRAKLESQGIDAFSISEIKAGLGDNWVKFGEWVVGDFLPKLYDKYNEKYVEKYGTEITRHENYFPFKIYGGDIVTKDELESFDNGNTIPMPSALKERVKHSYQLSTTEDALKILNEHVAEMEDWYHFADMREDISTLLSSRAFRETLKLQGPNKWRKFRDAMHTLAGVDKLDESVTSQVINEAQSMYASSAVGFRYWTALKQLQSMIAGVNYSYNPRFQARLFANILMPVGTELLAGKVKNAENTFAGMVGSCYWAWKNLPQFRERYRNGKMGNIMLEYESVVGNSNSLYRWIKKNVSQKGLFLNQVFDAAAVAVYSKSIYDYEYTRSIRKGATEEDAHKYAMTCAETNYNKTQQSSGRAYVSKMQVSGNPIEKGLTTFQTASLGFMRKSINDINDIQRAYRLLRLGKEKPLHSISKGAKATVDLLWDGVVMPASWNLINVIGVAGFYYGAKAIFNALFGGDDDNAPTKDATGKTALDRFIEGHSGDVAFATISAPLQGTILNNLVNSAWSGYGGWTPTMAEGAISEVLRSAGETLKGYKDSDSLSGYIEDLDEDAAKYTIKTVLYALFRGYTGIDMKTVERFYNAFYDYKVKGSSLNLISAANFLSTPMSSMRDHEAKDYYLGAYGKTSETAKDLEDYIVKRAYADGKIFKREVESGGARGKVAELFRSRAFKRDLNKYVDEWAEYHIRDASDATDYHDEWLKNHERKEIIRKNRELEYSDEEAKQKTDSLKLALGYEQKSGNSERTLRYNLVLGILRQIKKKLTGGDKERKEAFALMKELERIDKVKGHTHSDYVKLAEKAGVKDFQMIPKGVSESGKYVNKSDIDNGTVARGEVKGSYGIIATADDVKADARFRKLQDGGEKQKAKAKEVMKMYSDGDISYQDAYRRMTDIGEGLVTAVYASEADRLIKDLKTKLTKAVKAGDDKAADAIMEQIRSIRGKVIDGDMKPKEEVAKMLLNSIE